MAGTRIHSKCGHTEDAHFAEHLHKKQWVTDDLCNECEMKARYIAWEESHRNTTLYEAYKAGYEEGYIEGAEAWQ